MAPVAWFQGHPRIRNLKAMIAFTSRELMEKLVGVYKLYFNEIAKLPESEQVKALGQIASGIQSGKSPRENPLVHRNYDIATGTGSTGRVRYTIYSHCGYQQTGLLQAFAASSLIRMAAPPAGFMSPSQAFGHRNVLGVLERFGYARMIREV
jgi:hypothetical protein